MTAPRTCANTPPAACSLSLVHQVPDGDGAPQTLPHVQVGGGLVEHEDVGALDAHHGAGEPLQLASRQVLHVPCPHIVQV